MATYITLSNFTEQGARTVKDTAKRAEALGKTAKKFGVTVKDVYWTLGSVDTVTIVEAPDEAAVTAFWLAVAAQGNVRTQTLRAFSAAELGPILSRVK
jgi:uncharacterized protein with GYD domain